MSCMQLRAHSAYDMGGLVRCPRIPQALDHFCRGSDFCGVKGLSIRSELIGSHWMLVGQFRAAFNPVLRCIPSLFPVQSSTMCFPQDALLCLPIRSCSEENEVDGLWLFDKQLSDFWIT